MFLTKKGKFSHNLSLEALKNLLHEIKIIANKFNTEDTSFEIQHKDLSTVDKDGNGTKTYLDADDFPYLPLDLLLDTKAKEIVKQMSSDFIKGHQLENSASINFVYDEFLKLLGSKDFYNSDIIDIKSANSLFTNLKNLINEEIKSTKIIIIPVLGAFIEKGQKCVIGSVEFMNTSDFVDDLFLFKNIDNSNISELANEVKNSYKESDRQYKSFVNGL